MPEMMNIEECEGGEAKNSSAQKEINVLAIWGIDLVRIQFFGLFNPLPPPV